MNVVILGWGSLIWDPRDLPHYGPWRKDGPLLQLEFSRVSSDSRLTLVIDNNYGALCSTYYALSPRTEITDAVEDLRRREGTVRRHIGYFNNQQKESSLTTYDQQIDILATLGQWCDDNQIGGVVWTALPSNFQDETGNPFSVDAAIGFLKGLAKTTRENALKYIQNAPEEVITPLRNRVNQEWPA
jgi:hypothetical protein